ncbi:exodeoxyribonuclease VII large subunit [Coprococcus catus]|uniref:exodeoxyribonuclease VII large subunit n=1 Tax=Coprococcus catus TaxID=116085 RepID=UPI001C8B72A5|nr:exodeoxyribonuclease VII large subunit [Coprococcus catus]MBX9230424.1 exodeoxyribonuclease VII large subunit [Coprococcus catus]MCT6799302.1 exodeoxyribonuclease VII large subunit [Coprococcus catus]
MNRKQVYSVSSVNQYIKSLFMDDFALNHIYVRGEVSNCKYHSSGHIYFTLKDRGGAIACVMFAGNRKGLNFRMTEGMAVIVFGSVSVYERDGRYQLYAREIMQEGAGKLYEAYEALKKKLLAEGLFDEEHKLDIPKYPKRLGVVTARTGAAVQDIINVSLRRNPWLQIVFCPATVQGEGAVQSVVRGIRALEEAGVDVMIVGRGGGSIEDLWAFNEEMVARAVYDCKIPVISAVGHETDTTIIDYVADLRTPTPSAAAELAVPDMRIVLGQLQGYEEALEAAMEQIMTLCRQRVDSYARVFRHLNPQSRLNDRRQRLMEVEDRLRLGMERRIEQAKSELAIRTQQLEGVSPLRQLERGYAYVSDENGHGVASAEQVTVGQHLFLDVKDGMIESEVTAIQKQKR